jgi:hypothetical protein
MRMMKMRMMMRMMMMIAVNILADIAAITSPGVSRRAKLRILYIL